MYFIQHYFICSPSKFTVSEDARIESRTVANLTLTVRRSNTRLDLIHHSAMCIVSVIGNFLKNIIFVLYPQRAKRQKFFQVFIFAESENNSDKRLCTKLIVLPWFLLQNKTAERRQNNQNGFQCDVFDFFYCIFRFHEMLAKKAMFVTSIFQIDKTISDTHRSSIFSIEIAIYLTDRFIDYLHAPGNSGTISI